MTAGGGRPLGRVENALREGHAGGKAELLGHEVDARHELGHRVLDLEPGVDLEEPEGAVVVAKELARRRVAESGGQAEADRHAVQEPSIILREPRGGRLLDQLLVSSLDRAVAFAERNHAAGGVAEKLHLDVARGADLAFQVDDAVAECRRCLAGSCRQRGGKFVGDRPRGACRDPLPRRPP